MGERLIEVTFETDAVFVGDADMAAFHFQSDEEIHRTMQGKGGRNTMLFAMNQNPGSYSQTQRMFVPDPMDVMAVGDNLLIQMA